MKNSNRKVLDLWPSDDIKRLIEKIYPVTLGHKGELEVFETAKINSPFYASASWHMPPLHVLPSFAVELGIFYAEE